MNQPVYEVIITGGSYAGLSAAMALGRAGRKVLIIDSGQPCNRQTPFSHNFLTRDGETPAAITAIAKEQVLRYPTVQWLNSTAGAAQRHEYGFSLQTADGENYSAQKLLFATGVKDKMPDIPGFADCWGISVIHCPYCHGYEVKGQKTGLLASGAMAFHMAGLLRNWTSDLSVFSNGPSGLDEEQKAQLQQYGIGLNETPVKALEHQDGHLQRILLEDGSSLDYPVVYGRPAFEQHCRIPATLGCSLTEDGLLQTEDSGRTTNPDVFAAGDNSRMARSISLAVASGMLAAATINNDLCAESFRK